MSKVTMTMPRLGETMEHGVVAAWLIKEGEPFLRGDPIIEFETDKTAVEYPALGDGVLVEQLVSEGDQVDVGAPVATVDIGDGPNWLASSDDTGDAQPSDDPGSGSAGASSATKTPTDEQEIATATDSQSYLPGIAAPTGTGALRATPVARRLARQHGLRLDDIKGTGRRGRIEHHDIDRAVMSSARGVEQSINVAAAITKLSFAGDIAYSSQGPATGSTYLLLHGFAADHSAWALLASAVAKADCQAIAVDLPGHGASRLPANDTESLATGLKELVGQVVGKQDCHVVAHSMGAIPAVQLVLDQLDGKTASNVKSLTLIAPAGMGYFIDTQFVQGMGAPSSSAEVAHLLRRLSERPLALSSAAIDVLYESLAQGRLKALAERAVSAHGQRIDILETVEKIAAAIPVRLIVGHADRILDWQDVHRISPRVSVHHLPSAGHMPHWDEPRLVADIILSATRD